MASESSNVVEFKETAVLASAFKELFAAIRGPAKTNSKFGSLLEILEATCEEINPVLDDMEIFNMILDRPPNELKRIHDLMEKGKKLVTKCSKVRWVEFYHRYNYAKELVKLDEEMRRFFLINVAAINARNVMEVAVEVREIRDALRMLTGAGGVPVTVVSGPGGCGKTTLVKKIYPEIEGFHI